MNALVVEMLSMKVLPLAKELEQLVTAMQEYFSICSWDPSEHYRPTERRLSFNWKETNLSTIFQKTK